MASTRKLKRLCYTVFLLIFIPAITALAQTSNPYSENVQQAQQYFESKQYEDAARAYSRAFASNHDMGRIDHRYEAARCWALTHKPDSAFYQLERIIKGGFYIKHHIISRDTSLSTLHNDPRWASVLSVMMANQKKSEPNLNEDLVAQLDTIFREDQTYRKQIDEIAKKYGYESEEIKRHWQLIAKKDSLNLEKVTAILDRHGWLGKDVVGAEGSLTLFLVIQHADNATQEKYLPMVRNAVKDGKAFASNLALLEDRVALNKGKLQIYGSQISRNPKTGKYYVLPLQDPENVDKRRAEVGLPPLSEYVKNWGTTWSIEQYKKDLEDVMNSK